MSTSEKWTVTYSPCPCGHGKILDNVDSPDNPWSKITHEYELACEACRQVWALENMQLHNRAAYEAKSLAYNRLYQLNKELDSLGRQAIELILTAGRPSIKEEYRLLNEAGVCHEGPIRYKRARERGVAPNEMCSPRQNIQWVAAEVPDPDMSKRLNDLMKAHADCQRRCTEAHGGLQTIAINTLCATKA